MGKFFWFFSILALIFSFAALRAEEGNAATAITETGAQSEAARSVNTRRNWGDQTLLRLVSNADIAEKIGLSADSALALREEMGKLQERQSNLQEELVKLLLQQTKEVAALLEKREKQPDTTLKLVEEIGKLRTEIAKITIERIVIVRKYLNDAQIAKARQLIVEERRARGNEGRARHNVGTAESGATRGTERAKRRDR